MNLIPIATIKRESVDFLANLRAESDPTTQMQHASRLVAEAKAAGLNMKDYLNWKIDVRATERNERFKNNEGGLLSGYEAALAFLNLPLRNDLANGVSVQAAASTFQTFPGTRILFPQVVDDVARWNYRQTSFETVDAIVGNRRSINGTEMLMMVVNDAEADYTKARKVTEGASVPMHKVVTTEKAAKLYKFGLGWQFSYEFERRASIDILTPFANRSRAEIERSKVWELTGILVNGDGAYGAAPVVAQSSYNGVTGVNSVNGTISYRHLLAWLVARAQAGAPVDTVVGNYDAYLQWILMFAIPSTAAGPSGTDIAGRAGFQAAGVPILNGVVNFALSSAAPANRLIGITKAVTSEELTEDGSRIEESERSIKNQLVTFVSTEVSGFRLPFGDTRSVFNYGG